MLFCLIIFYLFIFPLFCFFSLVLPTSPLSCLIPSLALTPQCLSRASRIKSILLRMLHGALLRVGVNYLRLLPTPASFSPPPALPASLSLQYMCSHIRTLHSLCLSAGIESGKEKPL